MAWCLVKAQEQLYLRQYSGYNVGRGEVVPALNKVPYHEDVSCA